MKDLKKLPFYRKRIQKILVKLKLTPTTSINKILKDESRRSYSSLVENQKKTKFFIKIRLSDTKKQKAFFSQSYWLGTILNKHKPTLYYLTPKMVDGQVGAETDYLLYQFVKGHSMGSRYFHDVFNFKREDLPKIIKIYQAIKEIQPQWFPSRFRRRGRGFFRFLILKDILFDEKKLARIYSSREISQIRSLTKNRTILKLLDKNTNTFQHGDFQAPNFYKIKTGSLMILDFDQCSLTNPFYDAAYLYTHAFRKPSFRNNLIKAFVNLNELSEEDKLLFHFTRFCPAFVWVKIHLEYEKFFKKRRDFPIRKKALSLRVKDTKSLLKKIQSGLEKIQG